MEKDKAIQIAQAVKAGTAHVFISENEAISALDKISRIEDLIEGTIDHLDRDDAIDMLYEVKSIISDAKY